MTHVALSATVFTFVVTGMLGYRRLAGYYLLEFGLKHV